MSAITSLGRKLAAFPSWLRDLVPSLQENRRLNRRVAELLVPLADRDEEKARELLAKYRETTLAP